MRRGARRIRAVAAAHPLASDVGFAVVLGVLTGLAVQVAIDVAPPGSYDAPSRIRWIPAVAAMTLPLGWRRRYPLTVLAAVTAAKWLVIGIQEFGMSILAFWIALYAAGAYGGARRRDWVRAAAVAATFAEVAVRVGWHGFTADHTAILGNVFLFAFTLFVAEGAWVAGDAIAARRVSEEALREQADELRRERVENARRAVFDERVRIARELHDVVAHHVSVMGVQAGAVRRVMRTQPAKAEEVLSSIEGASRQAVVELQRMLGFLRREGDTDGLAPQPGLAQLDDLADQVRQAVDVTVDIEGRPTTLPRSLDVSAYRIVQEALTNTIKHAQAQHATVRLAYGLDTLEVEVLDDGRGAPNGTSPANGHGLIGMRERVALHGGRLRAGPRAGGGFAVHAELPIDGRR